MSFFKLIESKLFDSARPHKLPEPKLNNEDNQFTRIRMRLNNLDKDFSIATEYISRKSEENSHDEGLVKVSHEIFRYRFLACFEQSADLFLRGRILITDKNSLAMIKRAMDWLTIKRSGVSCIFNLKDRVSNDLTKNLQVIYLINISQLTDNEFNQLIANLRRRVCRSCFIFLTYIIDPYDVKAASRLRALQQLITMKSLSSPWIVGAFHAVDPWVALIDSEANLAYLKQYISQPKSLQANPSNHVICCRLAFRLVNVFEQMNQFPVVRAMKTWHSHNFLIGQLFMKGLNGLRQKRHLAGNSINYQQDYLLIIIDRSVDLLTPILHSNYYQAFIEQELETPFPYCSTGLDSKLRNVPIDEVSEKLTSISKELKACYAQMSIKQQEIAMNFVRSHLEIANRLMTKFNDDYRKLLSMEQDVIDKLNRQSDKRLIGLRSIRRKMYKDTVHSNFGAQIKPDMNPSDLHRLVIVRSLISQDPIGYRYLKKLLGREKFTYKESKIVFKYSQLMKDLFTLSETFTIGFPVIRSLVDQVYSGLLTEDKFPFIEDGGRSSLPRKKLCIFVLGGLSYNEIQYSGVRSNQDVTLISDNLLTAQSILSTCFP